MPLRQNHLSGLDGLRALAVLSVVAYHLGFGWARGGYLGVDLFFVLSGFLITTLLLEEHVETGGIAFLSFWGRRARRLLPALFLMIAVVVAFPWLMTEFGHATSVATIDLTLLRGYAVASFFYVANWFAISSGHSYFAQFSAPSPLQHTWSLAIEEQFYLVWPFVIYLLARGGVVARRRLGVGVSVAVAVGSSLLMALLFHPNNASSLNFVYNATFTRFFDLAAGATLAWLVVARPVDPWMRRWADSVGFGALSLLLVAMVVAGTSTGEPTNFMFEGGFLLCAVLATVVVAAVRVEQSFVARLFSLGPLRSIGKVSYGIYLWHWPIIVFVTPALVHEEGHRLLAIRLVLLALVTVASYYVVELPIRQRRWPVVARRVVAVSGTAVTLTLILVLTAASAYPTPNLRTELARYAPAAVPAGSGHTIGTLDTSWLKGQNFTPKHRLHVVLMGDSVSYYSGAALAAALDAIPDVRGFVRAFPGFGIRSKKYWGYYLHTVMKFHPQVVVIEAEYDDLYALSHPAAYRLLLHQFTATLRSDGVEDIMFATTPRVTPPPYSGLSGAGAAKWTNTFHHANSAWRAAALATVADFPGHAMLLPVASSVELHGLFAAWIPPPRDPSAPRSTWARVRMVDNTHLCPIGAVQYGAAIAADVAQATNRPSAVSGWWLGNWINKKITVLAPSPTSCPNDHP